MPKIITQSIIKGIGAGIAMLAVFFLVVTFISGWAFTLSQFFAYWYFIVGLAVGFGIQIGLYSYLKQAVSHDGTPKAVIAISGTTSTAAIDLLLRALSRKHPSCVRCYRIYKHH